jgi:uncharacterized protein
MSTPRIDRGDFIGLRHGARWYPVHPLPEDVVWPELARALGRLCRWRGHTDTFYSVAQHCIDVSALLPRPLQLWGLLHDAHEAYLGDIPAPLKPYVPTFEGLEDRSMHAIFLRAGIDLEHGDCVQVAEGLQAVKVADLKMLATEARDLMGDPKDWRLPISPREERIVAWTPDVAARIWLDTFEFLSGINPRMDAAGRLLR